MTGRLRYLPSLDGLRAFAVLGVICYHGGLSWAPGGFLGVEVFFVLSGFLITTLLLSGHGGHVVVLTELYFREGWPQLVDKARSSFNDTWADLQNQYATAAVSTTPDRSAVLDLNDLLDPKGHYTGKVNGKSVRTPDFIHLNDTGADFVAGWLVPQLLALGPRTPPSGQRGGTTPTSLSAATTSAANSVAG